MTTPSASLFATVFASWGGFALLLAGGLLIYLGALTAFTLFRLIRPPRRSYAWAVSRGVPGDPREFDGGGRVYEAWTLDRAGLRLPVWDLAGEDPAGPVVVLTHGWGESRVTMLARADAIASACARVVLWDLPGHGEAPGICGFGGREAEDLRALCATIGRPVVLLGFSLGAEIVIRCAAGGGGAIAGLILEAPYRRGVTPARNMLRRLAFPRLVNLPLALGVIGLLNREGIASRWRDLAALVRPGVPTLVLHGGCDAVCPPGDGEAIARAAGGEFALIRDAAHDDLWAHERTREAVRAFLARR
jgi:pimeloyl-ACP methyl ester carboxylesterase